MVNLFAWIIMSVIIFAIIVNLNPQFMDEVKEKIAEIDISTDLDLKDNIVIDNIQDNSYKSTIGCSYIQIEYNYLSTKEDSKSAIQYINQIRQKNGKNPISFDERVFELAVARAKDMREYNYLDHTNPTTGTCPDNLKRDFGFRNNEYLSENANGNPEYSEDRCTEIEYRSMNEVIDSWMESRGHRYNLLYNEHTAGAVGCYKNMCTFLGLNRDRFGEGCYTGDEGLAYWESAEKQPGEI